jgi:hypothetical protein
MVDLTLKQMELEKTSEAIAKEQLEILTAIHDDLHGLQNQIDSVVDKLEAAWLSLQIHLASKGIIINGLKLK